MAPSFRENSRKISYKSNSRGKDEESGKLEAKLDETTKHPVRSEDYKKTVSDLVYQYLETLAKVNQRRKQRHNARSIFHRAHIRKPRDLHPDRQMMDLSAGSISNPNIKFNLPTYLPLTYENTFSQLPRSSLSRKIVDNYAKAIDEGRNIARKYVCKALTLAVHSGFLVPTDNKGQILRVSSNLCLFQSAENIKNNKNVKRVRYDPVSLNKSRTKRKINNKIKKRSLRPLRTKRLQGKRKIKRKAKKY